EGGQQGAQAIAPLAHPRAHRRRSLEAMIAVAALVAVAVAQPAAPVEAPPPPITLALGSTNLVLGVDQETELRVQLAEEIDSPNAPRLLASAGHIDDLVRTGPRSWLGRFVLPAERFPQAVILVADLPLGGRHL